MVIRGNAFGLVLLAIGAGLLSGCNELSLDPAPGPYYGDRLPTQTSSAKPPGLNPASGAAAVRVEVLPAESTTLTQSPQILVATVHDANGAPCRNCRVDWKLEGVGAIVAVDESGTSPNLGRMLDDRTARSYTESAERSVSRDGNAGTAVSIQPGQSWCVISSPTVGDSRVTVHAGDSAAQAVVVRHWVEDNRVAPRAGASPLGGEIALAHYESSAAFLTLKAPSAVAIGQTIACSLTVNNSGSTAIRAVTVRATIPDGLQVADSKPSAVAEGKELVWVIAEVPARRSQTMDITFKSMRTGLFTLRGALATGDGAADEKTAITEVVNAQLKLTVSGPATARLGEAVSYEITVRNLGSGPATRVMLGDVLDAGLEHATKANPIELPLGTLAAGETKVAALVLTPRRAGALVHHLTATADGNLTDKADSNLSVQEGKLAVKVAGPTLRYVGRPAVWEIQITNPGSVPVSNVVLNCTLPTQLTLISASEGGQAHGDSKAGGGALSWHLGTLGPREQKAVQISTRCEALTERTTLQANVAADAGVRVNSEASLAIRGLPAYRLQVVDLKDPIQVGENTTYKIDVTNQGSLAGNHIQITADVPPQLRIINARGPVQAKVEGQRITFSPVEALQPKQMLTYEVEVQALQPNDAHIHVELRSPDITDPVTVEESTTIVAPGAAPPATRPVQSQPDSFTPASRSSSGAKPPPDWSSSTDDAARPASDRTGGNWRIRH
jgi:uncharacterized repeat protein (TIGR01451 family)